MNEARPTPKSRLTISMGLGGGNLCHCPACRIVDDLFEREFGYAHESRLAQANRDFDEAARLDALRVETLKKIEIHNARCRRRAS